MSIEQAERFRQQAGQLMDERRAELLQKGINVRNPEHRQIVEDVYVLWASKLGNVSRDDIAHLPEKAEGALEVICESLGCDGGRPAESAAAMPAEEEMKEAA